MRGLFGVFPVFLALTIVAQGQASGTANYQARADAALQRRQLAGMTQDLAAMRELVNKLQFDLQDLQRENQTLRQKIVELQRAQLVRPAQADLGTDEMEKILSGMRAQIYKDIGKLRSEFFASLSDMQKQMNTALNNVSQPPPPSSGPSAVTNTASAQVSYEEYYEHVVVKGDTLYGITRDFKQYNVHLSDIKKANSLNDKTVLTVGQKLILPVRK